MISRPRSCRIRGRADVRRPKPRLVGVRRSRYNSLPGVTRGIRRREWCRGARCVARGCCAAASATALVVGASAQDLPARRVAGCRDAGRSDLCGSRTRRLRPRRPPRRHRRPRRRPARAGGGRGGRGFAPRPPTTQLLAEAEDRRRHLQGAPGRRQRLLRDSKAELGKDFLWVTQIKRTTLGAGYGGQAVADRVVRWERQRQSRPAEAHQLRRRRPIRRSPSRGPSRTRTIRPSSAPSMWRCSSPDGNPVIDVTSLLLGEVAEFSPRQSLGARGMDQSRVVSREGRVVPAEHQRRGHADLHGRRAGRRADRGGRGPAACAAAAAPSCCSTAS